jgi:hypothetical protein
MQTSKEVMRDNKYAKHNACIVILGGGESRLKASSKLRLFFGFLLSIQKGSLPKRE